MNFHKLITTFVKTNLVRNVSRIPFFPPPKTTDDRKWHQPKFINVLKMMILFFEKVKLVNTFCFQIMSRRSSSTDRSSLGPLRIRTENNKQSSGRRSRSADAKGRPSNIGRPASSNRPSFGSQSGIPRRSVVGQVAKFGQGLQIQKNRYEWGQSVNLAQYWWSDPNQVTLK